MKKKQVKYIENLKQSNKLKSKKLNKLSPAAHLKLNEHISKKKKELKKIMVQQYSWRHKQTWRQN